MIKTISLQINYIFISALYRNIFQKLELDNVPIIQPSRNYMKSNDHFCILSCSNPCFCGYIHQNHVRETSQFWPIFVKYKGKSRKERTFQMLLSAGKYMNDTF